MSPAGRQPPPVVPTLTEVIVPAPSAPPPATARVFAAADTEASGTGSGCGAWTDIDELADRVLDRVLATLDSEVAAVLDAWWQSQRSAAVAQVSAALRDELAAELRVALVHHLRQTPD